MKKYINLELTTIQQSLDGIIANQENLDIMEKYQDTIAHTVKNGGKVIFTGIGKNVYACQKLAASYSSIGIPSFFMDAVHAVHGDLGVLSNNDLLICMSKSGNTSELANTLAYIHSNRDKFQFTVFGIDCNVTGVDNAFDKYCDEVLHVNTYNEIDALNLVPTTSAIILQIVGDIIGVATAEQSLGFNREVFRLNHPGGTIGITLK